MMIIVVSEHYHLPIRALIGCILKEHLNHSSAFSSTSLLICAGTEDFLYNHSSYSDWTILGVLECYRFIRGLWRLVVKCRDENRISCFFILHFIILYYWKNDDVNYRLKSTPCWWVILADRPRTYHLPVSPLQRGIDNSIAIVTIS